MFEEEEMVVSNLGRLFSAFGKLRGRDQQEWGRGIKGGESRAGPILATPHGPREGV